MEGLSIITYKSKQIYYVDYSGIGSSKPKVLQLLNAIGDEYINKKLPSRSVLALTNVANLHFDNEIMEAFKKGREKTTPYEKKVAVIGLRGIQKIAYNFIVTMTQKELVKAFDTEDEAKEWLAKD